MSFPRIRDPGLWIDDSVVFDYEFELIDGYLSEAVDGRGGAYVLSSALSITGDYVTVDDLFINDGASVAVLNVSDTAIVDDLLRVLGRLELFGDLSLDGALLAGGNGYIGGNLEVAGDLTVDGDVSLNGPNIVLGDTSADIVFALGFFQAHADAYFEQDVAVDGTLTTSDTNVNGALQVVGATFLNGDVFVDGALEVTEPSSFASLVTFTDGLEAFGPAEFIDVSASGNVVVSGDVNAAGNGTFDALLVNDSAVILGATVAGGDVVLGGGASSDVQVAGVMRFTTGKVKWRTELGTNANSSWIAALVDAVYVPAGTLSAAREMTIDDAGAEDGMRILFRNADTGHGIVILSPGGSGLDTIGTAHDFTWVEYERITGTWRRISAGV